MQECSCLHLYHKCVKIWEEVKGKKRLLIPVAFTVEWDKLLTKKAWKSNQIK